MQRYEESAWEPVTISSIPAAGLPQGMQDKTPDGIAEWVTGTHLAMRETVSMAFRFFKVDGECCEPAKTSMVATQTDQQYLRSVEWKSRPQINQLGHIPFPSIPSLPPQRPSRRSLSAVNVGEAVQQPAPLVYDPLSGVEVELTEVELTAARTCNPRMAGPPTRPVPFAGPPTRPVTLAGPPTRPVPSRPHSITRAEGWGGVTSYGTRIHGQAVR